MNDFRLALRQLGRSPGFTAVAVLTLGLGIGANTALFSLVNRVLLSPLPVPEPDRLIVLRETDLPNQITDGSVSGPNYLDWRDRSRAFAAMAAAEFGQRLNLSGRGEPVALEGASVTPSFFDVFPMPMMLGRRFLAEEAEPGRERVVILGHGLWQRRFGGDPAVLGQTVMLGGEAHVVVGVMGPTLSFIEEIMEVCRPFPNPRLQAERGSHYLQVFGRLAPGVTLAQARAELETIAAGIARTEPGQETRRVRLEPLHAMLVRTVRPAFLVLYAAVALVLFIACANVANLLLARGETRTREMAIRAALGAGRRRMLRQSLTESVVLAAAGAALGLGLAHAGIQGLRALAPTLDGRSIPFFTEISLDGRVLAFTAVTAVSTGILFGLLPAWRMSRVAPAGALKEAGRGVAGSGRHHRALGGFVVMQVALSVVLLVVAGLLVRNLVRLAQVAPGFETRRLLTLQMGLPATRYAEPQARMQFFRQLLEEVQGIPGVQSAAVVNLLPLGGGDMSWTFDLPGAEPLPPGQYRLTEYRVASPGYFETLHIPVREGRSFTATDDERGRSVVVVNEAFARRFCPRGDAVGKRMVFGATGRELEIVGVVGNIRHFGLGRETPPTAYRPLSQDCGTQMALVVRSEGDLRTLGRAVQERVWRLDPAQAVTHVRPMAEWVRESLSVQRFSAVLQLAFAAMGLILAAVGLYGVLAYVVNQRVHEIGVRMALGAGLREVRSLVLRRGLRLVVLGLAVGTGVALIAGRFLEAWLAPIPGHDPLTLFLVLTTMLGVALLACYLPARRATQVDPAVALRCE